MGNIQVNDFDGFERDLDENGLRLVGGSVYPLISASDGIDPEYGMPLPVARLDGEKIIFTNQHVFGDYHMVMRMFATTK